MRVFRFRSRMSSPRVPSRSLVPYTKPLLLPLFPVVVVAFVEDLEDEDGSENSSETHRPRSNHFSSPFLSFSFPKHSWSRCSSRSCSSHSRTRRWSRASSFSPEENGDEKRPFLRFCYKENDGMMTMKSSSSANASSSYHRSPLHTNGGKVKTPLLQNFSHQWFGLGGGGKDKERERDKTHAKVGIMKRAQNETTFHENSGSSLRGETRSKD